MTSPLISAAEVHDLLRGTRPVRVLDVRWRLDQPEGRPAYLDGHLPGAVYVDLERELSRHDDPAEGRHPLPTPEALQASVRRWGVDEGDLVVVYDDLHSIAAARTWWVLTQAGVPDVRVLDGGLRAWLTEQYPLELGDVLPRPGDIALIDYAPYADIDDVQGWPWERGVLLDVRAPERYRGESEALDPVAGHIPGAVNLPTTQHLRAGRFRTPEELRAEFATVGAVAGVEIAAYCGSGIAASHTALAGVIAGLHIAVYPGSWSEWSRSRGRLVATGSTPAREVAPL